MNHAISVAKKPHVKLTAPSHVRGVHQGNQGGRMPRKRSFAWLSRDSRDDPRRATGINAEDRRPINPASPRLSPP